MISLSSHVPQFLTYLLTYGNYSEHTLQNYKRDLQHFQSFLQTDAFLKEDITPQSCKSYIYYLQSHSYSASTIHRHIASLRSFWKFLKRHHLVDSNPWMYVTLPKKHKKQPYILRENHVLTFIDSIEFTETSGSRDQFICQLLYATGIRVSELVAIDIPHIRFSDKEILILGKGQKERLVIYGQHTNQLLHYYLEHDRPSLLHHNTDALFLNTRGERLTTRSIQRMIKEESVKQGLSHTITPHTLRHSFATDLINNGADLKTIQELLGHENLSTTQVYTQLSTKTLEKSFKKSHPRA